jgi:hypothetical protein
MAFLGSLETAGPDMTFRSAKLLASCNGKPCIRCGKEVGVVPAHYTGVRRISFGGGLGIKVHDFMHARLCGECHLYMDQTSREKINKWEHSEEFMFLCSLTLAKLFEEGTVKVA